MKAICRFTKAGGEACAKGNMACFQQIMCNCSSDVHRRRIILMYLIIFNPNQLF